MQPRQVQAWRGNGNESSNGRQVEWQVNPVFQAGGEGGKRCRQQAAAGAGSSMQWAVVRRQAASTQVSSRCTAAGVRQAEVVPRQVQVLRRCSAATQVAARGIRGTRAHLVMQNPGSSGVLWHGMENGCRQRAGRQQSQ